MDEPDDIRQRIAQKNADLMREILLTAEPLGQLCQQLARCAGGVALPCQKCQRAVVGQQLCHPRGAVDIDKDGPCARTLLEHLHSDPAGGQLRVPCSRHSSGILSGSGLVTKETGGLETCQRGGAQRGKITGEAARTWGSVGAFLHEMAPYRYDS